MQGFTLRVVAYSIASSSVLKCCPGCRNARVARAMYRARQVSTCVSLSCCLCACYCVSAWALLPCEGCVACCQFPAYCLCSVLSHWPFGCGCPTSTNYGVFLHSLYSVSPLCAGPRAHCLLDPTFCEAHRGRCARHTPASCVPFVHAIPACKLFAA